MRTAAQFAPETETFCLTLAFTGARISEALALTPRRIDYSVRGIVIRSLKKRRQVIFRTVPVPPSFLERMNEVHSAREAQFDPTCADELLWPWCRTTAWARIKNVMQAAGIKGPWGVPKGLRHALGVEGTAEARVPLNVMQRWLGHSRIETTAIYTNAVGEEERSLATRLW